MIKKLIFLIFVSLVITGCEATYQIELDYDEITEQVDVLKENNDYDQDIDSYLEEWLIELTDTSLATSSYKSSKLYAENKSGIKLERTYDDINELSRFSPLLLDCFTNSSIDINPSSIVLDTGSGFTCFNTYEDLDLLNIKITTKYVVKEHNATKVEGNIYTWQLDRQNNFPINIEITNKLNNPSWLDILNDNPTLQIALVFVTLMGIPSIFLYIGYLKYKKMNEI
jgi:hypothetical protein